MSRRKGEFSARTKLQAWIRSGGCCEDPSCGRPIKPGRPQYDHDKPLGLGGDDSLANARVLCVACHSRKTHGTDRPLIGYANERRKTDLNLRGEKLGRPIPGSKRSGLKRKMDGTVVVREPKRYSSADVGLERLQSSRPESRYTTQTDGVVLVRTYTEVNHEVLSALNDQVHMRFSEQRHRSHTVASQRQYLDQMVLAGNLALGIFIADDKHRFSVLVGTMGCQIDDNNKLIDIGIMLLPGRQGLGYALRAWKLVLAWALDSKKGAFQKVEAGYHAANEAMSRICAGSGMFYEGRRCQHFLDPKGTRSDMNYWGAFP